MIDPRVAGAVRRLAEVRRILPVTGGKGGIGKSTIACLLALSAARRGRRIGLLDLDLTGPCDHVVLGVDGRLPTEQFGIDPLEHHGVRFLSVTMFAGNAAVSLRGADSTNALLELLAITRWERLDALVVDMPPGLGDVALDAVRFLDRAEYVVVAAASKVVVETVRRNLDLLRGLGLDVAGVVENMRRGEGGEVRDLAGASGVEYLGAVPFDVELEGALGSPEHLLSTDAGRAVERVADRLEL